MALNFPTIPEPLGLQKFTLAGGETDTSRQNGGSIKNPPETSQYHSTAMFETLQGNLQLGPHDAERS